jgi:hypothetical protein
MIKLFMEWMHLPSLLEEVNDPNMGLAIQKSFELDRAKHPSRQSLCEKTEDTQDTDETSVSDSRRADNSSPLTRMQQRGGPGGMSMQHRGGPGMGIGAICTTLLYFLSQSVLTSSSISTPSI